MMSGIRGKDTGPELAIRRGLHRLGFRFRLHRKDIPGTPDIVIAKYRAVIFVNGCFWHGHDCPLFRLRATRTDFWKDKIDGNRARDLRALNSLAAAEWRVAVVWECALRGRNRKEPSLLILQLSDWLRSEAMALTIEDDRTALSSAVG